MCQVRIWFKSFWHGRERISNRHFQAFNKAPRSLCRVEFPSSHGKHFSSQLPIKVEQDINISLIGKQTKQQQQRGCLLVRSLAGTYLKGTQMLKKKSINEGNCSKTVTKIMAHLLLLVHICSDLDILQLLTK